MSIPIIASPWAPTNKKEKPLPEYPRPLMLRENWQSLNGEWDYAITAKDAEQPEDFQERILVPFAIETAASGACIKLLPEQKLWYRRELPNLEAMVGKRIILNFGAVDWRCSCFINGKPAGEHQGGYLPFSFDITEYLSEARNELILSVWDPTDRGFQQRGKQTLIPGTIYYTATSGIWQTVWIEAVPAENHIISYKVSADIDEGSIELLVNTDNPAEVDVKITAAGEITAEQRIPTGIPVTIKIKSPRLWSPETPFLYDLDFKLCHPEGDEVKGYFAFRKITAETGASGKKRIFLNNKPLFLHAPLDQGYWPESGMTPPSDEAMLFDIRRAKELGFNSIRKHIKIEPERWYYHADRLGMLVIQDMVSGGKNMAGNLRTAAAMVLNIQKKDSSTKALRAAGRIDEENREEFEGELKAMLDHLHNHPSIIMWVPFNESWGQFDAGRIGKFVEDADRSRLVDRVSGWFDQGGGNFRSRHTYIIKLKKPPARDERIYFISEYGGYNLSEEGHLWDDKRKFGYRSYKTNNELAGAYTQLIRGELIPLIQKGLGGAVYTQLYDVEIETNGLFTYDRRILKIDEKLLLELNSEIYEEFSRYEEIK